MIEVEKFDLPFDSKAVRRVLVPRYKERYAPKRQLASGMRWTMLASIFVIMYMNKKLDWQRDINYIVFLLILVVYFITSLRSWLKAKRHFEEVIDQMESWIKDCEKIDKYELAFNEETITLWSDGQEDVYKWSDFGAYDMDGNMICLLDDKMQMSFL